MLNFGVAAYQVGEHALSQRLYTDAMGLARAQGDNLTFGRAARVQSR
jgi:hypothetical protein